MSESPVSSGKVTLFRQEAPGGLTYRIPALLYLPAESAFLAFAEKRSSFKDEHAEFLVMRRGLKDRMSVQWGPQESLETAMLPKHRTMSPCPVYDRKSGRVFLFFICVQTGITEWHQIRTGRNAARLCYVISQDGGRTWSQTTDLTEQVIGEDLKNWATFAVGPGHGVQLSSGRLVVPAYTYYIHMPCSGQTPASPWTHPHCFTFYSDDGGQSWSQSQLFAALRTSECQVAELTCPDESRVLYYNARSPDRCRAEAISMADGRWLVEPSPSKALCDQPPHGCQGSVVSFAPTGEPSEWDQKEDADASTLPLGIDPSSASPKTAKSWLIFSHPTHRQKRLDLGIYLNTSPLQQKGYWSPPWVLHEGPSGYSDLAVCEEGESLTFGCLFECGVSCECEAIAFRLFTDVELLRNVRETCSSAASQS